MFVSVEAAEDMLVAVVLVRVADEDEDAGDPEGDGVETLLV